MWKRVQTSREAALNGLAAVVLSIIDLICMRSQGVYLPQQSRGIQKGEDEGVACREKAWPQARLAPRVENFSGCSQKRSSCKGDSRLESFPLQFN